MKARWIGAILAMSVSTAFSATTSESKANTPDNAPTVVASNAQPGGGGGHPIGVSRPGPVGGGSSVRTGAIPSRPGAARPIPSGLAARPNPSRPVLHQRATIRQSPGRPKVLPDSHSSRSGANPSSARARPNANLVPTATGAAQPRISRQTTTLRQAPGGKTDVLITRDGRSHAGNWSRNNPRNHRGFDQQTRDQLRSWQGHKSSFSEACHHQNDHHRHHHNRDWWHHHCPAVVLVDWGYWGWYDGWWYPAWGYDSSYSYYEYDGPIYGSGDLLPDEIVANVQSELQRLGYYPYEVDGIFGPSTQEALARYQRDAGLPVTGAIDPATLASLGLTDQG